MMSALNNSFLSSNQDTDGVGGNWTLDFLFNYHRLYQLSELEPTRILEINSEITPKKI